MTTDTAKKKILITHGPMSGQTIETSGSEADNAISEGWARDPAGVQVATYPATTPEQDQEVLDKATAGAARLRDTAKVDPKSPSRQEQPADQNAAHQTRDMHAGQSSESGYPTRGGKPK